MQTVFFSETLHVKSAPSEFFSEMPKYELNQGIAVLNAIRESLLQHLGAPA